MSVLASLALLAATSTTAASPFPTLESRYEWRLASVWEGWPIDAAHGPVPWRDSSITLAHVQPVSDGWIGAYASFIERLDLQGNSRWRVPTDIERVDGLMVTNDFIAVNAGGLHVSTTLRVYAAADGHELWRQPVGETFIDSPYIVGDRVFIATDHYDAKFRLDVFDLPTGKKLMTVERASRTWDVRGSLVLVAEAQRLTLIDVIKGTTADVPYACVAPAKVRYDDGAAYVACRRGEKLRLAKVGLADGKQQWRTTLDAHVLAIDGFVVGRSALYLMSERQIVRALDRERGTLLWSYGMPAYTLARLPDGRVVATLDGPTLVLEPTTPPVARRVRFTGRFITECIEPDTRLALRVGDAFLRADRKGRVRGTVDIAGEVTATVGDVSGRFPDRLVGARTRYDFGTVTVDTCINYD